MPLPDEHPRRSRKPIRGTNYLKGYDDITRQEDAELKRMSVREAVRRLEILLRAADHWKK